MRMTPRITAAVSATAFAGVTAFAILLFIYRGSMGKFFEELGTMKSDDVLVLFALPIAVLLVGYVVWGVLLRRPIRTRRKAIVIGTVAGATTAIVAPFALCFSTFFTACLIRVTLAREVAPVLGEWFLAAYLAIWPALVLVLPLAFVGWLSGSIVPVQRASSSGDAAVTAAPSPTRLDCEPSSRRDAGEDPNRIAMQPAS